jgi:gluconate 2-dehydrogenase gamma chain
MQGFYGSPRHGGNKNYMSYQMMGIDFPLVVGRNHYKHLEGV